MCKMADALTDFAKVTLVVVVVVVVAALLSAAAALPDRLQKKLTASQASRNHMR